MAAGAWVAAGAAFDDGVMVGAGATVFGVGVGVGVAVGVGVGVCFRVRDSVELEFALL